MKSPLVSVIVSAYNRPDMLRTALDSLVEQTFQNFEIIVQDDSTNDKCEVLVDDYLALQTKYTHNRPSLGTVQNLLAGYRKAKGKYFCTLNDDDLYQPTYLQTMVEALESDPRHVVAFADHNIIDEFGVVLEPETVNNSRTFGRAGLPAGTVTDVLYTALIAKAVPGMFALYRRNAIDLDNFPDGVSSAYDYWLTYLAVRSGAGIHYTPQRLTSYRVHESSQTSAFASPDKRLRYLRYNEFIDLQLLSDELVRGVWPLLRKRLSETLAAKGFAYLRMNDRTAALREFRCSLDLEATRKNLLGWVLCFVPGLVRKPLFAHR